MTSTTENLEKEKSLVIVGLPSSGKTTFIAAFYHLLQDEAEQQSLALLDLPEQSTYLDEIVEKWRGLAPAKHTRDGLFEPIVFNLIDIKGGEKFKLSFPDVSGEDFNDQWEARTWRRSYRELVIDVDGIILFVHPDVVEPITIVKRDTIMDRTTPTDVPDQQQTYDPKAAPTGVKLVELLQFIEDVLPAGKVIRIAVVISAWDIEQNVNDISRKGHPEKWLEVRVSLLYQYLKSNYDWLDFAVFGVSAQGGIWPDDSARLMKMRASQRVKVVANETETNDIALPIRWAIED